MQVSRAKREYGYLDSWNSSDRIGGKIISLVGETLACTWLWQLTFQLFDIQFAQF